MNVPERTNDPKRFGLGVDEWVGAPTPHTPFSFCQPLGIPNRKQRGPEKVERRSREKFPVNVVGLFFGGF